MAIKINFTFPDGNVLTLGNIVGLSQPGIPTRTGKSLGNESIAWGWGTTLNKYLKSIESICNAIDNQEVLNGILSTEGINAGEVVKKAIAWITEKLKALANVIKEFISKVKAYLDGEQHKRLTSDASLNTALKEIKRVLVEYVDSGVVDLLVQDRILMAHYNAKLFHKLYSQKSFEKAYDDFLNEVKIVSGLRYNANDTEYDTYKEAIVGEIEKINESSRELVEEIQTKRKNMNYMGDSHPAVIVIKYYKVILFADYLIQERFISELNKSIESLNRILKSIEHSAVSNSTDGDGDVQKVQAIKTQTAILSNIISSLLGLNISQSIPTIDRAIAALLQKSKQKTTPTQSPSSGNKRNIHTSPDLIRNNR